MSDKDADKSSPTPTSKVSWEDVEEVDDTVEGRGWAATFGQPKSSEPKPGTLPSTRESRAGLREGESSLPPEPRRVDFPDEETYLEARAGWQHRVAPLRGMRKLAYPSKDSQPPQ